jgi:lysophospholipase L1-like esterase
MLSPTPTPSLYPDIRICFVGDSFVNGTGDPECLGWTGRVCARAMQAGHQITHYNLGIRRNTSADIAARWLGECELRLPPEIDGRVVFSFGANDTVIEDGQLRVSTKETLSTAQRLLSRASQLYPCLWIGPPPVGDDEHNKRIGALCAEFQELASWIEVPYLPVFGPLLEAKIWQEEALVGDGAHPQAGGYAVLAGLVEAWPAWWF